MLRFVVSVVSLCVREDLVFSGRKEDMPFRIEVFSKGLRRTLVSHAGGIPIEHFTPRDPSNCKDTHEPIGCAERGEGSHSGPLYECCGQQTL